MQGKPRVFISYCRSDGATFATQLRQRLEREHPEITLWQDVISERGGRDWWLQITEALDQVEYMVLVLTPDAMKSAMVRKEWRYARQQGVCVYPVQGGNNLDLSSLPRWIRDLHIEDIGYDAQQETFTSAGHWQKFINQLDTRCETPRVPFMAEDLPENFVERPREFDRLVALLRNEQREEPVAITAALQGAGGFGKTTLARALCHDERIQEVFDDGVLWTTLGENPGDLTSKIVDLIEVLSGERPGFKEAEAASTRLSELLADRDILMVIDDVWNAAHMRPFLNGGKRCARLITTRSRATLPGKAHLVNVDAMQQSEAVNLLAAGLSPGKEQAKQLLLLAAKLGEWPLLLRLVNSVLRERVRQQKQPLDAALDYAWKALAKRGLTAFDARDAQAREQAVATTLGVSLELLTGQERDRYAELAIFPEDTDVPLTTIARLWGTTGGLDELDTEELCARLHGLSLLLSFDLTKRQVRLHDVMRKFLASQLPAADAVHGKLVDAWGDSRHLPDSYAWRFLAHHLAEGHRVEQLREILLDFDWMQRKLEATDITALVADYDYLADQDRECRLVQGALQLSAHVLTSNHGKTQLAMELLGRLLASNSLSIQALLCQAAQSRNSAWFCPIRASLIPPGGPLLRTLSGHIHGVHAVAITADGTHAVSASEDHTLKVWELKTGRMLHSLEGHSNFVYAVAITADGTKVISASNDNTLRVWELKTGSLLHSLQGHSDSVNAVTITWDGAKVVSASNDNTLKVWNLKTGNLLHSLQGHSHSVNAVAITADGAKAVSASNDNTLKVWNLKTGSLLHSLQGHSDSVNAVTITADGAQAVSASDDHTLKVWDLKMGKLLHSLKGHSDSVVAVAIAADGTQVVSASGDKTLKVWDLKTGKLLHSLDGHSYPVTAVAITGDGTRAVSASWDSTLKLWELKTGKLLHSFDGHSGWVNAVAITADDTQVVSASEDSTLKVWVLKTAKFLHSPEGHSDSVTAVAITGDGAQAVSASWDSTLKLWELKTGKLLHSFDGHSGWVNAVAITADGEQAVSASSDHTLKVWDLKTGKLLHSFDGHSDWVNAVAITADGERAVSASSDHTLKVWDLKTGKLLHSLEDDSDSVNAVAITADGEQAVSASIDHTVKVWDLKTGKLLHSLEGHTDSVWQVTITADGAKVVSASVDDTLKVWALKTGKLLHSLEGHRNSVWQVAITANGAKVVSASEDHTLKVWALKTGKLLHSLQGHSDSVVAVAITADGEQAVSASSDHTLKVWDLKTGELLDTFTADGSIDACAVAPDGKTVIAGDALGRVHFLRLGRPKEG
jgi:WD40 repeat protein